MQNSIIPLGTHLSNNHASIGRKAAALNQLTLAGFPVPPGICITANAFNAAIAPFAERIYALRSRPDVCDPVVARDTAQAIADLLGDLQLPPDLHQELSRALPSLGSEVLAVRSSAMLEDLPGASFAGQYETVLGVKDEHELADAILTCWRSFFSAHALAAQAIYAQQHAAPTGAEDGMAVLIQPLLNAECSGVCFTVDPVHLRADVLLVTSAWGLGVGVVDGTVPVDTASVRRSDLGIADNAISDKHIAMRYNSDAGVQPVAVSASQRQIACLPESWLKRVAQFGLAAEQYFGQPQDVEWAITDQQVWLLQSRPITTLPEEIHRTTQFPIAWANEQERNHMWKLNWHNSRASALLLPAEMDFINTSSLGGQTAVQLGGSARTRWHKFVNGRMYTVITASTVSPADCRIRGAAWRDLFERLQQQNVTMWEHWGPEIMCATQRLAAFDATAANGDALADHLEDALAVAQQHWMIHTLMPRPGLPEPLLDIYAQMTGKPREEAEADMLFLFQGADTVQTRVVERLYDLAKESGKASDSSAVRPPESDAWASAFEQFMSVYGGRFILQTHARDGEHSVELPIPWREAPQHVLDMIALYRPSAKEGKEISPREAREQIARARQIKVDGACAHAQVPALVGEFRQRLDYFQRNAAFLDEHNHYIDQLSEGQFAQSLIYAGRWLAARGDLAHPYDVFWLHPPEVLAALRAQSTQDFGQMIAERKAQFEVWRTMPAPAHIGLPQAQLPERPPIEASPNEAATSNQPSQPVQPTAPNTLIGQATSVGRGAGRARIITEFTRLTDFASGDVLVAVNAGPEWTPIFPILAGIVLDWSYPADHSAITAREFGVPAVFGTAQATQRIPPGTWVTVDGEAGVVSWE